MNIFLFCRTLGGNGGFSSFLPSRWGRKLNCQEHFEKILQKQPALGFGNVQAAFSIRQLHCNQCVIVSNARKGN
ncbi:hypothetical protein [Kingella denitrificans]